jgi:hypothetical protein
MPRYFMHLRDGTDIALDEEGTVYANDDAMRRAVLQSARDCVSGDVISKGLADLRLRIDAENEAGEVIYSLPFDQAVSIVLPGSL